MRAGLRSKTWKVSLHKRKANKVVPESCIGGLFFPHFGEIFVYLYNIFGMFHVDPNKIYPKQTVSQSVIRFQDCDPLKHLNNAKYFDYFFNAREDQVPKLYGLHPMDFYNAYNAGWVIYNHNISYLRSALVGEWVTIITRLVHYDNHTIVNEYVMLDEAGKQLKTVLWSTMKYIDFATGRKVTHHDGVLDFLKSILYPSIDYYKVNFEQRVKDLNNFYKLA